MRRLFLISLSAMALSSCATPTQMMLDAEVKRLCAIDGGIKVYENVILSADKFNEWGQVNFYKPNLGEGALGDEYLFKSETTYYKKGNPELWRSHYQVIRRVDGRVLGESIGYSRRGGDVSGPWHDSSYGCPENRGDIPLLMKVFHK